MHRPLLVLTMISVGVIGCGKSSGIGTAGSGGQGGGSLVGTGGAVETCGEPEPCDGYDNRPDASLVAVISCLSPHAAPSNVPFVLAIYGHHLATGPSEYAIVTFDSGTPLNGIPVTACDIDVQVPADQMTTPGKVSVVVSPGGWIQHSVPASLTVE